jgi:LacI family transcriptional regulator
VLKEAGCFDYRLIIEISGSAPAGYDFGYAACKRLLELNEFPEAILAFNDLVAIGAMRQIKDSQLSVPEDVSVVGFDDLDISRFTTPRLSTVQVHRRAAATEAIRLLIAHVGNPDEAPSEVILPTEFIRRESTP